MDRIEEVKRIVEEISNFGGADVIQPYPKMQEYWLLKAKEIDAFYTKPVPIPQERIEMLKDAHGKGANLPPQDLALINPTPEEPPNPYPEKVNGFNYSENPQHEAWRKCAAAYRPLLEQAERKLRQAEEGYKFLLESQANKLKVAERRVKELEGILAKQGEYALIEYGRLLEKVDKQIANLEAENARLTEQLNKDRNLIEEFIGKIAALESQLKPVSGWLQFFNEQNERWEANQMNLNNPRLSREEWFYNLGRKALASTEKGGTE